METVENIDLTIGAYIKRNDYRDVIVATNKSKDLKGKLIIGSSSKGQVAIKKLIKISCKKHERKY